MISQEIVTTTYLFRHGAIPAVIPGSWSGEGSLARGAQVVVETSRGIEFATILEQYRRPTPVDAAQDSAAPILRIATPEDRNRYQQLQAQAKADFAAWGQRISDWNLDLQLIDLEWTLDESRLTLYVLNERGPECTKLALQAAAAGFGVIDVQPVSSEGLENLPKERSGGGGCGSCGSH